MVHIRYECPSALKIAVQLAVMGINSRTRLWEKIPVHLAAYTGYRLTVEAAVSQSRTSDNIITERQSSRGDSIWGKSSLLCC